MLCFNNKMAWEDKQYWMSLQELGMTMDSLISFLICCFGVATDAMPCNFPADNTLTTGLSHPLPVVNQLNLSAEKIKCQNFTRERAADISRHFIDPLEIDSFTSKGGGKIQYSQRSIFST